MIGAHSAREFKPLVDAVDRDHHRRAAFFRDRAGVHAQTTATLDHHAIAEADRNALESHYHLRQCAVRADDHRVGDVVGHLEEGLPRMQEQVVGERTARVWPLVQRTALYGETLAARFGDSAHTAAALAARTEVLVRDAIAFVNLLAIPVGGHSCAERMYHARCFVPEDPSLRRGDLPETPVAAPDMKFGTADVRARDAQRESAGARFRYRQFANFERLTRLEEQRGAIDRGHGLRSPRRR